MTTTARATTISLTSLVLSLSAMVQDAPPATPASPEESVTVYRVGKVVTMDDSDSIINNAVVIVRGSKIESVGKAGEVALPEGAEVVEMPACWLVPGLVEGHNHISADSSDLHDYVYLTNPGLRTLDAMDTENEDIERARAGGVTTALLIPGSGTNMSGFGTIVKFTGGSTDESVLRFPGSLKIAQAGNPERFWYGVGRSMMNYNTRHTLEQALRYHEAWQAFEEGHTSVEPPFNPTYHDFRGLLSGDFVASVHTQQYQVVMTTIDMLARKLDIKTVLDHSEFDGWKTAPFLRDTGNVEVITGPRVYHFDRTQRKLNGLIARWWQAGIEHVGVNTDSPVIPQEELSYQAAMGCWYGWIPYEALRGVTRTNAHALMIDDVTGSIQPGKDADFGLWSGDPIDPRSTCWLTVINGKVVHDNRAERRF